MRDVADEMENEARTASWAADEDDGERVLAFWSGGLVDVRLSPGGSLTIGRDASAGLRVDRASVSRAHARIVSGDVLTIEDLGSRNGTRVDGRVAPAGERVRLRPGQVVEIGEAMLVVQRRGDPGRDPPPTPRAAGAAEGAMARLERLVRLVAVGQISVLLLGETGVGKEVVAESLHRTSPRAKAPFVRLNCAALPEPLLEGELFGYQRGAFTGAHATKAGLLETAEGGTVLLDEVGELPAATQAKLLRVLEAREVRRLGELRGRPIDVRFLAATNRDVGAMIAAGSFRADLYYRLNGVTLRIPPLRDRVGEIVPLARTFLARASASLGRPAPVLGDDAIAWMERHAWPGNVRELKSVVECAALLATAGRIGLAELPAAEVPVAAVAGAGGASRVAVSEAASAPLQGEVAAVERRRIVEALDRCAGSQTRAAALLGISRRMLVYRMDAFALPRPRKKP